MDFTLNPEIEDRRQRIRAFVDEHLIPLELKPDSYDAHENIHPEQLKRLQALARQAGLWSLSMPKARGGQGFDTVGMADRKSVGSGKRVSVRVDLGCRRIIKTTPRR